MLNYRRNYVAGGTFFFTMKTERNAPVFQNEISIRPLGTVFREMQQRWPVKVDAIVLLPDHLHTIWTLPSGEADYPKRWAWLKKEFTRHYLVSDGEEQSRSESRQRNRRRGVWQRRNREHTIKDEEDFDRHFDYVHWNLVKPAC